MVRHMYKVFETRAAARAFQRERGGVIVGSDSTFSRDKRYEWACAVNDCGHDPDVYPFAVVWNETV